MYEGDYKHKNIWYITKSRQSTIDAPINIALRYEIYN